MITCGGCHILTICAFTKITWTVKAAKARIDELTAQLEGLHLQIFDAGAIAVEAYKKFDEWTAAAEDYSISRQEDAFQSIWGAAIEKVRGVYPEVDPELCLDPFEVELRKITAAKTKAPSTTTYENNSYGETCEDEDNEQGTSSLGSNYAEQPYRRPRIFLLLSMLHDDPSFDIIRRA